MKKCQKLVCFDLKKVISYNFAINENHVRYSIQGFKYVFYQIVVIFNSNSLKVMKILYVAFYNISFVVYII